MCQYIKSIYLKINSLFNKANAKNINLIIVNGLSRKRINKQKGKKKQRKRGGGGLIENSALAFILTSEHYVFSIKCTFSH